MICCYKALLLPLYRREDTSSMFSRIRYPDHLSHELLDSYLEAGWRCMGQAIYTSHFMYFPTYGGKEIYSTIPTRLPLKGYTFRKSLRKIYRKVHQQFKVVTGHPASFDKDKERVNDYYAALYSDKAITDPKEYLDNGTGSQTFDTREVSVYDGDQLVAFSYFASGAKSIYSKQGIYDPAYQKYSLGFFTMLEEIAYAQQEGKQYYYPGYVVPAYPEFDYKHRVGPLEYYELSTEQWKPFSSLETANIPINYMRNKLLALQEQLAQQGIISNLSYYRHFDIRFYDRRPFPFMEYPILLTIQSSSPADVCPIAVFDPCSLQFNLYNCRFFGSSDEHADIYRYLITYQPQNCNFHVAIFDTYAEQQTEKEILEKVKRWIGG